MTSELDTIDMAVEFLRSQDWDVRSRDLSSSWIGIDIREPEDPKEVWEIYCSMSKEMDEAGFSVVECQLEHDYIAIRVDKKREGEG